MSGPAAYPILAKVFGLLGLAFWAAAGTYGAIRHSTLSAYSRADGTVASLRRAGRGYRPVVEFTPAGGAPVRVEGHIGSSPPGYHVGETVSVRYPPADPSKAVLDTPMENWFFTLLGAVIGTPFVFAGLGFWAAARKRRQAAMLEMSSSS